jgi:hypothetical protein
MLPTWTKWTPGYRDTVYKERRSPGFLLLAAERAQMIPISLSRRSGQPVALESVLEVIENRELLAGHYIRRGTGLDPTQDSSERGLEDG